MVPPRKTRDDSLGLPDGDDLSETADQYDLHTAGGVDDAKVEDELSKRLKALRSESQDGKATRRGSGPVGENRDSLLNPPLQDDDPLKARFATLRGARDVRIASIFEFI
jgi:hypothetical protein